MLLSVCVCASLYYITYGLHVEPKIIDGDVVDITNYSFAASLRGKGDSGTYRHWGCTSSIITQQWILTAAHCAPEPQYIVVSVGHNNAKGYQLYSAHSFLRHPKNDELKYDIALIKLNGQLSFYAYVSKVALMQKPPYDEKAYVAGWGLVSEDPDVTGKVLKAVVQYVRPAKYCHSKDANQPSGTICAYSGTEGRPSTGDSGGPLVVRGYIQIGVVSYRIAERKEITFYSSIGYYYDWITKTVNEHMCDD